MSSNSTSIGTAVSGFYSSGVEVSGYQNTSTGAIGVPSAGFGNIGDGNRGIDDSGTQLTGIDNSGANNAGIANAATNASGATFTSGVRNPGDNTASTRADGPAGRPAQCSRCAAWSARASSGCGNTPSATVATAHTAIAALLRMPGATTWGVSSVAPVKNIDTITRT